MKTKFMYIFVLFALTVATSAQAIIVGNIAGSGTYNGTLSTGDGWGTNNGNGVDFWTISVADMTPLTIDVRGNFDYGISIYQGVVDTDFLGSFDNNSDYNYNFGDQAIFVAGTSDLFGPFNTLETTLALSGMYTVAIGGVDGLFQPLDYSMEVSAVPLPGSALLFGSALLGLFGANMRRKKKA